MAGLDSCGFVEMLCGVPPANQSHAEFRDGAGVFATTRWSLVLRAGSGDAPDAAAAMTQLCRDYWYPLYSFVRRRGASIEEAQDLTQGFFLKVIEEAVFAKASAEKGRLRSYLLGALQHFLTQQYRRAQTQKRGGGAAIVSIDEIEAEKRYALEPADLQTPEAQFERSWAFALVERVMARLGEDYTQAGRAQLFEKLQPYLSGKSGMPDYAVLGNEVGLSAATVAVAIHRMRRRCGELLREEIAQTVDSPEEVEAEIAYLRKVLAR